MRSKLKLYFDTSVISAYFDSEKPQRQIITQKWFESDFANYECYISDLVLKEILNTKNESKRERMINLLSQFDFIELKINQDISELANIYIGRSNVLKNELSDAVHLACASYFEIYNVASWNFKHFINIEVIKEIHKVNAELNYKTLEIFSLLNLGGDKYG